MTPGQTRPGGDVTVTVNGEPVSLPGGASVADAVARATGDGARRVAAARNGEVVARSAWEHTVLADGDRVEVVAAIQGGDR